MDLGYLVAQLQHLLDQYTGLDVTSFVLSVSFTLLLAFTISRHKINKMQQSVERHRVLPAVYVNDQDLRRLQKMRLSEQTPDKMQLLVFVNPKSGGQQGEVLFYQLRRLLDEEQVIDLSRESPKKALKRFNKEFPYFRVLVCGGDGSVGKEVV